MENDFFYVNHGNVKPRQHCNYGGIHLNTLGIKILADNFILALNILALQIISPFLKKTKCKHPKSLFFGLLNINSTKNKFESVQEIIQNTFDIFFFNETKIDSSFPSQEFSIRKYRIFRKDGNAHGRITFLC